MEQGRFALENAKKVVDYFSEIFDLDYPLPKVDLLAVHEFVIISCSFIISVDGMEDRKLTRLFESLTELWRIGDSLLIGRLPCCSMRRHQIRGTRTVLHMLLLTVRLFISIFSLDLLLTGPYRTCSPMVWKSCHYGLVV